MQIATGTVIEGKVILDGVTLPEGAQVSVFIRGSEPRVRLTAELQSELDDALDQADLDDGISGDELLEKLRKYG